MKNIKKLVLLALFVGLIPQQIKPMSSSRAGNGVLLLAAGAAAWYVGKTVWNWWNSPSTSYEAEQTLVFLEAQKKKRDKQNKIFENRQSWTKACQACPKNSDYGFQQYQEKTQSPFLIDQETATFEFLKVIESTVNCLNRSMSNTSQWTDSNVRTKGDRFEPFVQRLDVPEDAKVVVHGDFHGDVHSFLKELDDLERKGFLKKGSFEIADKDGYMIFLGDYVDRGYYGAEVIYTICRLKLANPGRVFMVRGNHEDLTICHTQGFGYELGKKFGFRCDSEFRQVYRLYEYMPVALYLGHNGNYIQCCHGGTEHGYNPGKLLAQNVQFDLLGTLDRKSACSCASHHLGDILPADDEAEIYCRGVFAPEGPVFDDERIGFMWNDFIKSGSSQLEKVETPDRGAVIRGFAANRDFTERLLAYQTGLVAEQGGEAQIKGIFRAHQHTFTMDLSDPFNLMTELIYSHGVYKVWKGVETENVRPMHNGIVWTFNVSPDSMYGHDCKFGFDAYAIIRPSASYEKWTMEVCNTQVVEDRTFMGYAPDPGDEE